MISFDEAIALIAQAVGPIGQESVPLEAAAGRILAEPLYARSDAPRRAVSSMDGYAVVDATTRANVPLRIVGEARAGAGFAGRISAGETVRIYTGAPLPAGADRCIMQEYATLDGDHVQFAPGYGPATHIRAAGSDFRAGDLLLGAGTRLSAQAMVAAAAADYAALTVARRPLLSIITTGDELATPGTAHLRADAVPETVSLGIAALVPDHGGQVMERVTGIDDLGALSALAGASLEHADAVVVAGGASVGDRDFAKPMFAGHGLELLFANVAIKPGKPVWMGRAAGKWVIGLPGNPTSALVTGRLFLAAMLARLTGRRVEDVLQWRALPLAGPMGATGDRETFVRSVWEPAGLVPVANQDSGAQATLAVADWLIRCPARQSAMEVSDRVTALPF